MLPLWLMIFGCNICVCFSMFLIISSRCFYSCFSILRLSISISVSLNKQFIFKTITFFVRFSEHLKPASAIFSHRLNCSCSCNLDNFTFLDKAKTLFELNIKEALYIKFLSPALNSSIANSGRSYFLNMF